LLSLSQSMRALMRENRCATAKAQVSFRRERCAYRGETPQRCTQQKHENLSADGYLRKVQPNCEMAVPDRVLRDLEQLAESSLGCLPPLTTSPRFNASTLQRF